MITFSTALVSDIPTIQDLAEKTWWPTYGPLQPKEKIEYLLDTFYSYQALAKAITSGEQEFVLLIDDGSTRGFVSFGIHPHKTGVIKIFKLYVLPATQGKGYGRALLDEVRRRVNSSDAEPKRQQLELNVYRLNPALKFYEKMGFKIIAEVNEPVGEFFFEDYVLMKQLAN